jgi:hypothetical protein
MHTDPKSSIDILEHVTEGGVHVQPFHSRRGDRRSFESVIAVVETETHPPVPAADTPSLQRRPGE